MNSATVTIGKQISLQHSDTVSFGYTVDYWIATICLFFFLAFDAYPKLSGSSPQWPPRDTFPESLLDSSCSLRLTCSAFFDSVFILGILFIFCRFYMLFETRIQFSSSAYGHLVFKMEFIEEIASFLLCVLLLYSCYKCLSLPSPSR